MFKPGQLVRSRKYGDLYVVQRKGNPDGRTLGCHPLREKRLFESLLFTPERLELIGNNYKSK